MEIVLVPDAALCVFVQLPQILNCSSSLHPIPRCFVGF